MKEKTGLNRPVYACTICGKEIPWQGGRLRLICDDPACHGERPAPGPIQLREGDGHDRIALLEASRRFFGSSHLQAYGEVFPLAKTPFLVAEFENERAGFLSYTLHFPSVDEAAVVLLAVLPPFQGRGLGRALQGALEAICRPRELHRVYLSTTNDNIPGLYFYQRIGYRFSKLRPGAAAEALAAHGSPGARGFGGIPLRDEIVLVKELGRSPEPEDEA
jgi:ribosomal protein S18 acetylase RimI-like enzyme